MFTPTPNTAPRRSCAEEHKSGVRDNGVSTVKPDNQQSFDVFCDQNTTGGGWTVFQKRLDGSVDFYRNWAEYKQGFGNLSGEFWLGLDKIHRMTSQTKNKLRVELEDFDGNTAYAEYDTFAVADEADKYRLSVGNYTGKWQQASARPLTPSASSVYLVHKVCCCKCIELNLSRQSIRYLD